ncbi:uncharacterized protein BO80DRAFT_460557 [Aspergillus ibericus CBS 121593]|uniref:Aminoglycoside phosphotransferase domain-containing protein n=1 Tax=Aspergillus ibericus CBS 121593 TaxID=1448316 RepID=A0A395HHA5_9EURO|nr:hypothetical protein BO80DRAFT_460557 [Aspergillus ibericus CBS 121593]RAL06348.1 hypothetical protein BO80DRAFT_460557 [Aspergillus ibericus CBS 121593]
MPKARPLLRGEITYSTAKTEEVNVLHRLRYPDQRDEFFAYILEKRNWIEAVVAHHLNLESPNQCRMADFGNWQHGSFNLCVPVNVNTWKQKQQPGNCVLFRLPLPYRVGDAFRPGNGDEKIRCEAGTYAWLEQNCPDIPIPRLYGFATSTGETFTRLQNLPFLTRCFEYIRRKLLAVLGKPTPTQYVRHQPPSSISSDQIMGSGYLLIEYIEEEQGEMLSNSWPEKHMEARLRMNLFRSLSRILLSITRIRLSKIGSFVIDRSGFLRLANRPLSLEIQDLENEEIPTSIPRGCTYSTVDSYATALLHMHDSRLRHQPNAINDLEDYLYQTSALTAMRTAFPSFFRSELRHGPFVLMLTDLHQSNIFVDKDWHITCLVDLEWACTRPIEMLRTPTWLTNKAVDEIAEEAEEYDIRRREFINVLAAEEQKVEAVHPQQPSTTPKGSWAMRAVDEIIETPDACDEMYAAGVTYETRLSTIMKESWESGAFWYSLALASPTGLFSVFYKQVQPRFLRYCPDHDGFQQVMPWYWSQDFVKIGPRKIADKTDYDLRLKEAFGIED